MISRDVTMKSLVLGIMALASVGLVLIRAQNAPPLVLIQVRGGSLRPNTPFVARLKNDLAVPITFCADFGKAVQTQSGPQAALNPFEIQKWNGKRWDTQLTGTDVGSGNTAISIDAHESKDFSLQVNASGRYRLTLTYTEGESDTKCPLSPQHANRIDSKPFWMEATVQK